MAVRRFLGKELMNAAVLTVGFGLVWGILAGWIGSVIEEMLRPEGETAENLEIRSDGMPLIAYWEQGSRLWIDRRFRDLEGNSVDPESARMTLNTANLSGRQDRSDSIRNKTWLNRLQVFRDEQRPPNYWYFLHDGSEEGTGYFVGYNSKTKARIGYIGLNGFRGDAVPPDERFPVREHLMYRSFWSSTDANFYDHGRLVFATDNGGRGVLAPEHVLVASDRTLYRVDLREGTVEELLQTASPIVRVQVVGRAAPLPEKPGRWLAIRTEEEIHVFRPEGATLRSHPVPAPLVDRSFSWVELADGRAMAVSHPPRDPSSGTNVADLFWISPEGTVEETRRVTYKGWTPVFSEPTNRLFFASTCPAPVVTSLMTFVFEPLVIRGSEEEKSYGERLVESWRLNAPAFAVVMIVSLVLAVWTFRRETAWVAAPRERILWTLFVFILGVPGVAGYLLRRPWPYRAACPECGAPAPRDDKRCRRCDAPFPEPELKRIEVFA